MGRARRTAIGISTLAALLSCARDRHAVERPVAVSGGPAPPRPTQALERSSPPPPADSSSERGRRATLGIEGASYDQWIAALRPCDAEDKARAKPNLPGRAAEPANREPFVSIAGRLVPGVAECTLMHCSPGPCCNGCNFDWVVVPRRYGPGPEWRVRRRHASSALRGSGMDCAVSAFRRSVDWVIVSGRIGKEPDAVIDADMCRLPAVAPDEPLTDEDYRRLMGLSF